MYHFLPASTFHVPINLISTIHVSFTKIHFTGPSNSTCYPITQLIQNQRLRFILPYISQSPSLNFHLPHYRRFYQHFTKNIISFFLHAKNDHEEHETTLIGIFSPTSGFSCWSRYEARECSPEKVENSENEV